MISAERIFVNSRDSVSIDLRCTVHAYPAASVIWQKDGANIMASKNRILLNDGSVHILRIKDIKNHDFGTYVCIAENILGLSEKSIELAPTPHLIGFVPPRDNSKHADFTWRVGSTENIKHFEIQYKKINVSNLINGNSRTLTIILYLRMKNGISRRLIPKTLKKKVESIP